MGLTFEEAGVVFNPEGWVVVGVPAAGTDEVAFAFEVFGQFVCDGGTPEALFVAVSVGVEFVAV